MNEEKSCRTFKSFYGSGDELWRLKKENDALLTETELRTIFIKGVQ